RLGLVSIVTEYGSVADDPALRVRDVNGSRISGRQPGDVGDQFWLVENAAFLVSVDAVVGEVFFPRRLIPRTDGIVKLLSATDLFILRNGNIPGAVQSYGPEKCDERDFHRKG